MPRLRCALLASLLIASTAAAQTQSATVRAPAFPLRFGIDPAHSQIEFTISFMGMSRVRGAFSNVRGTIMYAEGDPARSSVSVVIPVSTINTNSSFRDRHLRSPDFFDAEKYPYITFRSSRIAAAPQGFLARGALTMHGITKDIEIPFVQLNGPTPDAWRNTRQTFLGKLSLSRKEFGILGTAFWNSEFDPGRMSFGDQVDIELLVSATIPNTLRWGHPVGDSLLKSIDSVGVAEVTRRFKSTYAGNPRVDSIPEFAFMIVGQRLQQTDRVADAIKFYETVLQLRPGITDARNMLGEAYVKAGQLERARQEFERVLRDDPVSPMAAEWMRVIGKGEEGRGKRE
jgi:polyisoprenoid-binding protein YceI